MHGGGTASDGTATVSWQQMESPAQVESSSSSRPAATEPLELELQDHTLFFVVDLGFETPIMEFTQCSLGRMNNAKVTGLLAGMGV